MLHPVYKFSSIYSQTETITHTLTDLTLEDEGDYSCRATSSAGTGQGRMFLDVTDPPPYIQPTLNVTVAPGARAILDCVVESNVVYDIRWHKVSPHSGKFMGSQ